MNKKITKNSVYNRIFRITFLVLFSIYFQNANAQCSPDVSAPLPDNPNLPNITGECSVLLLRPTAYDSCENKVISGTVANNKLTYGVGTYTVTWTYTDGSSNSITQQQNVTVNPLTAPIITADGPTTFCNGDSVILSGSNAAGYLWENTEGTTYTSGAISVKTNTSYTLTVTSTGGCTATAVQKVVVDTARPATPVITAKSSTSLCPGDHVILKSSSSAGNTWTGGSKLDSIIVSTSGTFAVTVKNGCGSRTSLGKAVVVKPLTASITANGPTSFCPGKNVILISNSTTGNTWTGGSTNDSLTVSVAKVVTLTLNTGCGPITTASMTTTVNPIPAKPSLATFGPVCANAQQVPLPVGSPAGGTYSGNGVVSIPPLINAFFPGTVGLLGAGAPTIIYTVTDTNGCTNHTTTYVTLDKDSDCGKPVPPKDTTHTGVTEQNTAFMELMVYPNPTKGLLNIVIKNTNANQLLISIVDALGNEVYNASDKKNASDYNKQINLEGIANGVYTLKLIMGTDIITRKLIIQ